MKILTIGIIGFGTIGSGVIKVIQEKASQLEKKSGLKLQLKAVCDQDITTRRNVPIEKSILTTAVDEVIKNKDVQVVVELIGGIHPAKEYILESLKNKKHVVTANKALLAEAGEEIFKTAQDNGVEIYFEASVGGGIPIIKTLREGLISNRIENIFGIINGTSNYILSEMSQNGCDFEKALQQAQDKGYAENDPALDITGLDAAHKLATLSRMCFNPQIDFKDVYVEGIENIDLSDVKYADEFGFCIKPLAIAKRAGSDLEIRVHPTLLPKKHLLSNVNGVFNAIFINTDLVGNLLLYGPGAGQLPTASAVVSDLIDVAKKIGESQPLTLLGISPENKIKQIRPIDEIESCYYIRFSALDEPGVLSQIASILGNLKISIRSVIQKGRGQDQAVPIVMMTHASKEKNLRQALLEIHKLPVIKRKTVAIRVERG